MSRMKNGAANPRDWSTLELNECVCREQPDMIYILMENSENLLEIYRDNKRNCREGFNTLRKILLSSQNVL
jgi:hypothetical protein